MFETARLSETYADVAQDGSSYDGLLGTANGWLVDCMLPPERTTRAVRHRFHDEIWFVRSGRGQVWRSLDRQEEVVDAEPGMCLSIPAGTAFQFRTTGPEPFRFLIVQAPPWPEDEEAAFAYVPGPWTPSRALLAAVGEPEETSVEFRVTVGLGQDSVEVAALEHRAAALQEGVTGLPQGAGAVVVVDLVKAAAQLVVAVQADDALAAAEQALQLTGRGLQAAGLDPPGSVVTVEAESVPAPAQDQVLRPHPAQGTTP